MYVWGAGAVSLSLIVALMVSNRYACPHNFPELDMKDTHADRGEVKFGVECTIW